MQQIGRILLKLIWLIILVIPAFGLAYEYTSYSLSSVDRDRGNLKIKLPSRPAGGVSNPKVRVKGPGFDKTKTTEWRSTWRINNLRPGSYSVIPSDVTNGKQAFHADKIDTTVKKKKTEEVNVVYKPIDATFGGIKIVMPGAPAQGLADPEVTITGDNYTDKKVITWGNTWELPHLTPGAYKITSSNVDNGSQFFIADPINTAVTSNQTTNVTIIYKPVTAGVGKIVVNLPAAPAAGVSNPEINVTGAGSVNKKVVNWGTSWEIANLAPGDYTVTSSNVDNGSDFFQAEPVNAKVIANTTTPVTLAYTRVPSGKGSLVISLQSSPATGVANPEVSVNGMGVNQKQVVTWGTQWNVTNLPVGSYTVTGNQVDNGSQFFQANPVNTTVKDQTATPVSLTYSAVSNGRPTSWNSIKHVVIVILENTGADEALQQPFMKSLLPKGAYLNRYSATTHPSQPNYFALVAGDTFGADNDDVNLDARHIGDLLDAKGLTWKAYAENLPSACFKGTREPYARRHEPFISFRSVQSNPSQCAKIVEGRQFFTDLAAKQLPTYSFYVPNNNNNGHDTGVEFADNWLKNTFGPVLNDANVLKDTLFIITFDEDSTENRVYTLLLGAGAKAGVRSDVHYTHYSLLSTIEQIYQVGDLGKNDKTASVISDVWLP